MLGLVAILVIPVVSASQQNTPETNNFEYESKLFAIGVVRIDPVHNELTGFVLFGINDGDVFTLKNINIKYDPSTPVYAGSILPFFVHHIWYNPAS